MAKLSALFVVLATTSFFVEVRWGGVYLQIENPPVGTMSLTGGFCV